MISYLFFSAVITSTTLEISSASNNQIEIPIRASVDEKILGDNPQVMQLTGAPGPILAQRSKTHPGALYFIIPPNTTPESGRLQTSLEPYPTEATSPLEFKQSEDKYLQLIENGKPVFTYNFGIIGKEGVPEDRNRSCYIHPLWGLEGEILTDDFPRDHYHHRGLWWSWPAIVIDGQKTDLWTIAGIKTKFEKWLYHETGPVCAILGIQNGWYIGDRRVVEETVEITAYRAGEIGRVLDINLSFKALEKPVTLEGQAEQEKGYGGLCVRTSPGIHKVISSDMGMHTKDSNLMRTPWVDYSGIWSGGTRVSGSAIFASNNHPDFPPGWTLRYYGFYGVAWPGGKSFTIEPGDSLRLSYRVWIHKGDSNEGMVPEAYNAYTLTNIAVKP